MVAVLFLDIVEVEVLLLEFLQILFKTFSIRFVCKSILNVDFIKKRYHVMRLVLFIVDLFNTVEDHNHDNLVRHDASLLQKVLVTLLNAYKLQNELPLMVALSICFGSLYTQIQIASFILRLGVRLNNDNKPWPAGCFALLGSSSKFLIYFSSMVIGSTSSS